MSDQSIQTTRLWPKALALFLFGLIVLAIFQSSALITVTYDLPPHPVTERVVMFAESWHNAMENIGAAGVTEIVTDRVSQWLSTPVTEESF